MTEAFKRGFMAKMAEFEKDSNAFTDLVAKPVAQAARRGAGAVARGVKGLFGRGGSKAAPKITITPEEVAAAKVPPTIKITPEEVAAAKVPPNNTLETRHRPVKLPPPTEPDSALQESRTLRSPGLTKGRRPFKSVADLRNPQDRVLSSDLWADIDQAVRTAMAGKHISGDEDVAALAADRLASRAALSTSMNEEEGRAIAQKIMEQTEPARMAKHPELGRPGDFDPEPYDVSKLLIEHPSDSGRMSIQGEGTIPPLWTGEIVEDGGVPNWKASLDATKKYWASADGARGAASDQSPKLDQRLLDYLESRINRGSWPDPNVHYTSMPYPVQSAAFMGPNYATEAIETLGREGMPGWRPALFESYTK